MAGASGALPGVGSYPRVIRLEHGGPADGTIIETDTSASVAHTQRFHRSTDGGKTFEPLPSLALPGNIHGTDLFEMPADAGALPAGTLLFAAAVNPSGQYPAESGATQMQIPVYRSNDGAASWSGVDGRARSRRACGAGSVPGWRPDIHRRAEVDAEVMLDAPTMPSDQEPPLAASVLEVLCVTAGREALRGPRVSAAVAQLAHREERAGGLGTGVEDPLHPVHGDDVHTDPQLAGHSEVPTPRTDAAPPSTVSSEPVM